MHLALFGTLTNYDIHDNWIKLKAKHSEFYQNVINFNFIRWLIVYMI